MNPKYKYILFDADNTLFDFNLSEKEALCATFREFGIELSADQNDVYHAINDALWKKLERGETTREKLKVQRFAEFADYLGKATLDPAELSGRYVLNLAKQSYLIDGAYELCRELSKEYPLYIITNGITYIQKKRFAASLISAFFKGIFISEEMGHTKPEAAYFTSVARSIGDADASRYLVIGDSLTSDISGAVNFGCDSIWISPEGASDARPTYTVKELSEIRSILL